MALRLKSHLSRTFEVTVEHGLLLERHSDAFSALDGRRVFVVTTPTVYSLYGEQMKQLLVERSIDYQYIVVELGETNKTIASVQHVCASALYYDIGRKDLLVAFGGGVCSDVVGFAASMIRRGISHIRVPTTLIGQMDAGIGIKGGVNFRTKKNSLGCFHPPEAVYVDPSYLSTLPTLSIQQGLAEIIKVAVVADRKLFDLVATHGKALVSSGFQNPRNRAVEILVRSIEGTLAELQENPFEDQTLERLLDFGHTFSPNLEEETGFSLSHGEAVAIDIALTCTLAAELGILSEDDSICVISLLQTLGLPIWSPLLSVDLCFSAARNAVAHRGGSLNLVAPTAIGSARFIKSPHRLSENLIRRSIDQLTDFDKSGRRTSLSAIIRNQ